MRRGPPLPIHRIAPLAAFASAGGVIGGTAMRAKAHLDFFRTLDSRPAFLQALDNIQSRLGEKPPGQHQSSSTYPYPNPDSETHELADHTTNTGGWGEDTPTVNRSPVGHTPSTVPIFPVYKILLTCICVFLGPSQPPQRKSRWEEIRAEHARSMATRSSWDELRQNANRPKTENTTSDEAKRSQDPVVADRQAEQQKFDAMLEAERRRAASGP